MQATEASACRQCGQPTVRTGRRGRVPLYCSPSCRSERYQRSVRPKASKPCRTCGALFDGTAHQHYCSTLCCSRRKKAVPCLDCGRPLRVAPGSKGVCGKCHSLRVRRSVALALAGVVRTCPSCAEQFTPTTRQQAHCSRRCMDLAATRRKKAVRARAFVEDVTVADLLARDGPVCGVCGMAIDMAVGWPHPMSCTIDHRRPLSKGGPHCLANTQLAHLRCNSSKGNRLGGGEG